MMGVTVDRNDPGLKRLRPDGQQENYLVLGDEERAKGFIRPVRTAYMHLKCGVVTMTNRAIAETLARDPAFYDGMFCCACGAHFPLKNPDGSPAFLWDPDGSAVGS